MSITAIIVDDHELFRSGLKSMLEIGNIACVIAVAGNGQQFLDLLPDIKPDIILMDIDMPVMDGIEATRNAINKYPDLNILVLSMFGDENNYYKMIDAGARGFLLKTANRDEFKKALYAVAKGDNYFSNELLRKVIAKIGYAGNKSVKNKLLRFNDKELEILRFMCQGLSNNEIAGKIFLSEKTVANYRTKLLHKTGCKNSVNLVAYVLKNDIIEI